MHDLKGFGGSHSWKRWSGRHCPERRVKSALYSRKLKGKEREASAVVKEFVLVKYAQGTGISITFPGCHRRVIVLLRTDDRELWFS